MGLRPDPPVRTLLQTTIQTPRVTDSHGKLERRLRYVTPRQTCPQPNGIRRNLRSKTRLFTGFCNSHQ
ncbi:hypothetical protein RYX36_003175, partial [Vicia faba]